MDKQELLCEVLVLVFGWITITILRQEIGNGSNVNPKTVIIGSGYGDYYSYELEKAASFMEHLHDYCTTNDMGYLTYILKFRIRMVLHTKPILMRHYIGKSSIN